MATDRIFGYSTSDIEVFVQVEPKPGRELQISMLPEKVNIGVPYNYFAEDSNGVWFTVYKQQVDNLITALTYYRDVYLENK